jgi:hypothetical protein
MRFTRAIASRHYIIYGPQTFEHFDDSANPFEYMMFLAFAGCIGLLLLWRIATSMQLGDFSAFYCGGSALRQHLDPYQIASLRSCENSVVGVFHHQLFAGQTIPAPFPPVVLGAFAALSYMPVAIACWVWLAVTGLAYLSIVRSARLLSGFSSFGVVGATSLPLMLVAYPLGQLTLPVLALLLLAAQAWREGRSISAALFALGTLCSPSIGIPVGAILLVCDKVARVPYVIGALILGLVDFVIMPWNATLGYFFTVLPAHAAASLHQDQQYSLAHALAVLGVPAWLALQAGLLDSIVMSVFGVWLALSLARHPARRDLALLIGPAAAMLGGSFVHMQEFAVASLAALLVYREVRRPDAPQLWARKALPICIGALALPVLELTGASDAVLATALIGLLTFTLFEVSTSTLCMILGGVWLALDGTAFLMRTRVNFSTPTDQLGRMLQDAVKHGQSLENVWGLYIDHHLAWEGWVSVVLQLPAVIGLTIVLASAVSVSGGMQMPNFRRQPKRRVLAKVEKV